MSYSLIILDRNIVLSWAYPVVSDTIVSTTNNVEATADNFTLTLPNATYASLGTSLLFNNTGFYDFTLLNNLGIPIQSTIRPGDVVEIYLTNSSTPAGEWSSIPFSGPNGIVIMSASSVDNSIIITNGTVSPPTGSIDFALPTSIQNLNLLNNNTPLGFAVIKNNDPLNWVTRTINSGSNITITNGNGVGGNPIVNLNDTVVGLNYLNIDNFVFTGNTMTLNDTSIGYNLPSGNINGNLSLRTMGNGVVDINGFQIGSLGNIISPTVARVQCFFLDNDAAVNNITVESNYNIAQVSGSKGVYNIYFTNPFSVGNYSVQLTLSRSTGTFAPFAAFVGTRELSYVTIYTVDTLGNLLPVTEGISIAIFGN